MAESLLVAKVAEDGKRDLFSNLKIRSLKNEAGQAGPNYMGIIPFGDIPPPLGDFGRGLSTPT